MFINLYKGYCSVRLWLAYTDHQARTILHLLSIKYMYGNCGKFFINLSIVNLTIISFIITVYLLKSLA